MMRETIYGKEKLTIPTYPIGSPSLNPIIGEYRQEKPYPYRMHDEISSVKMNVDYEALFLENEYLKLTILPEIGGRLYSAFDKRNGKELFHRNNVIKPQLIGLTGAWISGGIEFNFPTGHRPSTMEMIETSVRGNADGSASVFIGETDKMSGVRFSVELRLDPGKAVIEQITRIYNPTAIPQRFFFWNTASYPDTENLVCRYPARWMIDEHMRVRKPWPYDGTVDVRQAREIEKFSSIFTALNEEDFFGVYDTEARTGNVHVGFHREVPGSKFWSWGSHEHGKMWNMLLTDDDGPYMEQQAGNTETQYLYHYLQPYQKHEWTEYWYQAIDTGLFTFANKHVALATSFSPAESGKLIFRLALQANEKLSGATVTLIHQDEEIFSETGEWTPERTEKRETQIDASCLAEGKLRLEIRDSKGTLLADHLVKNSEDALALDEEDIDVPERDDLTTRLVRIYRAEERHLHAKTLQLLDELLESHPDYVEAYIRKAVVQIKMLDYAAAETTIECAALLTPFSDELHYYTGLVRFLNGKSKKAKSALLYVNDISAFAPAANLLLGRIALKDAEWSRAERYFAKAERASGTDAADVLRAFALRKRGESVLAERLLLDILERDPLHAFAAAEYDQLKGTATFKALARGDAFNAIALLQHYADIGDEEGERFALDAFADHEDPLRLYHLGYLESSAGRGERAAVLYEAAENRSPDGVFPILPASLVALKDAVQLLGDRAPQALYLCGLIYNAKERFEEASRVWERCVSLGYGYSVLYRNYGFLLMNLGNFRQAIDVLERGISLSPVNYDILIYLNKLYKQEGLWAQREALLDRLTNPSGLPQSAVRLAISILNDLERYDEAVLLLHSHPFNNWENPYSGMPDLRGLYHGALIGRAKQAMAAQRWDAAIADLEQSTRYPDNLRLGVEHGQSFAREHYLLALCHEKKGDFIRALHHCTLVCDMRLAPDSPHYREYVKAVHKKTELEWLGFETPRA